MCIGLHRSEIVDADHLDVLAIVLGDGAQHVAADAAKAVDGNPNCHGLAPGLDLLGHSPVVAFASAGQSAKRNPPDGLFRDGMAGYGAKGTWNNPPRLATSRLRLPSML